MSTYLFFIVGFLFLIKGADLLVEGAASLAKRFKISTIVIGLTIVSFGTSAPEFIVNIFASFQGNTEIVIGNILGSNIANILLILGISSIIYPLTAKKNTVWKEVPFSLLAAILVGVLANDVLIEQVGTFSGLSRIDGIVLISFFVLFLVYTFGIARDSRGTIDIEIRHLSTIKSLVYILAGICGLVFGGKWIVEGAVAVAELFHMDQSVVGLTIVAVGTSLPELATSAVASYKKQTDIAIGNAVGSNIFNIFWVLALSSFIRPMPFGANFQVDILITIMASVILFVIMFVGKRHTIERWQGVTMVIIYIVYVAYLISTVSG